MGWLNDKQLKFKWSLQRYSCFFVAILYLIGLLFLGVLKGIIVTSSLTYCFGVFELDQLVKSAEQFLDILNQYSEQFIL